MVQELQDSSRSDMRSEQEMHPALPTPLSKIEPPYRDHDLNYRERPTLTHNIAQTSLSNISCRAHGYVGTYVPLPDCHFYNAGLWSA